MLNYAAILSFLSITHIFLVDEALEALEGLLSEPSAVGKILQELCILNIPSVLVTVEAGVGNRTVPMILLEMGLKGQAKNWTAGVNTS